MHILKPQRRELARLQLARLIIGCANGRYQLMKERLQVKDES